MILATRFGGAERAAVGHSAARRVACCYRSPMKRIAIAVSLLLAASVAGAEEIAVGSKAPPFSLMGSDGRIHTLAEHTGKQAVVLAWFPKAFTPG